MIERVGEIEKRDRGKEMEKDAEKREREPGETRDKPLI